MVPALLAVGSTREPPPPNRLVAPLFIDPFKCKLRAERLCIRSFSSTKRDSSAYTTMACHDSTRPVSQHESQKGRRQQRRKGGNERMNAQPTDEQLQQAQDNFATRSKTLPENTTDWINHIA